MISLLIIIGFYIASFSFTNLKQSQQITLAKEKEKRPISEKFPKEIGRWCDLIAKYSNNLDPNLIAALILVESGGNPNAISKSGAVGLMQIMPSDGKAASFICINGPCFADRPKTRELLDPEFNIKYGSKMLSRFIVQQGGVREGLMAYGPKDQKSHYADLILSTYKRYTNP